ncbi:hypothetical protein K491DRAFT_101507 [Lophiostoma macrostomum CBS 122681]|uniref:Zn(2)-C6 fungal-type domain-containing protein n=1 Tax=Lophiostoma macrostomum CBS 122681 TaxID=1314788 RepID=A0A6A6SU24_9PLEO|nr:hypothetical protein K491DRAFT_101507 [Lophiostoma macrostomum CBS 122681]
MVNTGRPSKGCLTCRKRRVKCDEVRPACDRCTKLGAECAWKDDWSQMVRRQEKWARNKVVQRVERVKQLRDQCTRQERNICAGNALPKRASFASQPQLGVEIYAVEHFYSDYAYAAGTCPFMNSIAPLYCSPKTPDCLHSVVPAVALASAGQQLGRADLLQKANQHYGTALRRLGTCLSDPVVAKHDAALLTIFLLELYELILKERHLEARAPWNAHTAGRHGILRLRGREQLRTPAGRSLFVIFYQQELLASFCGDAELLAECYTWMIEEFPPSPVASGLLLMHDVCQFIQDVKKWLKSKKVHSNEAARFLKRGAELEEMIVDMRYLFLTGDDSNSDVMRFYATAATVARDKARPVSVAKLDATSPRTPEDCARKYYHRLNTAEHAPKSPKSPATTELRTQEEVKLHLSITKAIATNKTRAMHILLLQAMERIMDLETNERLRTYKSKFCDKWHATIERLAVEILHEIPYGLSEVDSEGRRLVSRPSGTSFRAYLSLWPLKAALGASHLSARVRRRLEKRVKNIYEGFGIGIALDLLSLPADLEPEASEAGEECGDGGSDYATLDDHRLCCWFDLDICPHKRNPLWAPTPP